MLRISLPPTGEMYKFLQHSSKGSTVHSKVSPDQSLCGNLDRSLHSKLPSKHFRKGPRFPQTDKTDPKYMYMEKVKSAVLSLPSPTPESTAGIILGRFLPLD